MNSSLGSPNEANYNWAQLEFVLLAQKSNASFQTYAKIYKDLLKEDGIELVARPSSGPSENLKRLKDHTSGVKVGFVQDGVGNPDEALCLANSKSNISTI